MVDRIPIEDGKYTYVFDQGRVWLERYGKPWVAEPNAAQAWIAAACELEHLREENAVLRASIEGTRTSYVALGADGREGFDFGDDREEALRALTDPDDVHVASIIERTTTDVPLADG